MKQRFLLMLALVSVIMTAQAQQNHSGQSPRAFMLTSQARHPDREMKMDLLREIENGNVSMDADTMEALAILAGDGTLFRNSTLGRDFNNADIRMRAIYILGKTGGETARQHILRSLDSETDPNVRSAAFIALGDLGRGDDMSTIRIMNTAMNREMATTRSTSAAVDYLAAIQKLVNAQNVDAQTLEILTQMAGREGGFNNHVRSLARTFLRTLWAS